MALAERQHTSVVRTSRPIKRLISGQSGLPATRALGSFLLQRFAFFLFLSLFSDTPTFSFHRANNLFLLSFLLRFVAHAAILRARVRTTCARSLAFFVTRYCGRQIRRRKKAKKNERKRKRETEGREEKGEREGESEDGCCCCWEP